MSQWDDPTRGHDDSQGHASTRGNSGGWAAPGGITDHESETGTGPQDRVDHRAHGGGYGAGDDGGTGVGGNASRGDDGGRAVGGAVGGAGNTAGGFSRVGPGGVPELWPGPIPLRPLGFGEILESAFRVLRFNPRTIFGLSFVVLAVATVVGLALVFGVSGLFLRGQDVFAMSPDGEFSGNFGIQINNGLLSFVTFFLSGILVIPIAEAALGRRLTAGQSWARMKPRLLPLLGYLGISILITLAIIVPAVGAIVAAVLSDSGVTIAVTIVGVLIALLVLYTWITVSLSLAPAAIVLEQVGPITAIKRSFGLIRGAFWRTLGLLLVVSLITGVISSMLMGVVLLVSFLLVFSMADTAIGGVLLIVVMSVLTALVSTLVQPLTSAVTALIYLDRRFRTEALAVDLLAEAERAHG